MAAESAWAASAAGLRLLAKDYPDGTVCFDPLTGETRLLPPLAGYLLHGAREGGPLRRAELLAELLEADDDAEAREAMAAHLDDTAQLLMDSGLLVPC